MSTYTLTAFVDYAKEKAKNIIYLVLKKKPFSVKQLEDINKEIEIKLEKFFDKIIPQLNEIKPKDEEKFLKYMMLKATIKILDKIMEKNYLKMTDEDKIAAKAIYQNGGTDDFNEKVNENNSIINNGESNDLNNPYLVLNNT